jgi:hypothetical protein
MTNGNLNFSMSCYEQADWLEMIGMASASPFIVAAFRASARPLFVKICQRPPSKKQNGQPRRLISRGSRAQI